MEDQKTLEKFLNYLKQSSEDAPITETKMAELLGFSSGSYVRNRLINPLRKRGYNIATSARGIYMGTTPEHMIKTKLNIVSRINEMQEVVRGIDISISKLRLGKNPLEDQMELF